MADNGVTRQLVAASFLVSVLSWSLAKGGATYFSINRDIALVHGKGSENSPDKHGIGHPKTRLLLLTIDIQKLVKKRNIFIDPESLRMTDEFGVNFVVHQGIPVSAISQLDILQFRRMS